MYRIGLLVGKHFTIRRILIGFVSVLLPSHTVLFHEASCLDLQEAVLFHRDAVEAVQEARPDLTDY